MLAPHWLCNRRESLVEILTRGLDEADVVISSGGVSMGEKVCKFLTKYYDYTDMATGSIEACFGE